MFQNWFIYFAASSLILQAKFQSLNHLSINCHNYFIVFIFVLFPNTVLSLQFLNTTCFFTNVSVPVMQLLVTKKNKRREMILVSNQRKGICQNTKREREKVRTYKHTSIHSLTYAHTHFIHPTQIHFFSFSFRDTLYHTTVL